MRVGGSLPQGNKAISIRTSERWQGMLEIHLIASRFSVLRSAGDKEHLAQCQNGHRVPTGTRQYVPAKQRRKDKQLAFASRIISGVGLTDSLCLDRAFENPRTFSANPVKDRTHPNNSQRVRKCSHGTKGSSALRLTAYLQAPSDRRTTAPI